MSYVKQVRQRIGQRSRSTRRAKEIAKSKSSESKAFYAITTLLIESDRVVRADPIGFFWTEEEAVNCVLKNYGDWIETGFYRHAVVEQYEKPGLYASPTKRLWFHARLPKGGKYAHDWIVTKCRQPKIFKQISGYGAFG